MFRIGCFNHSPLAWGALVLSVSMALWVPVVLLAQESALDQDLSQRWANSIQPLLKEHCGSCHMDSANEGGVDLDVILYAAG
jgi:mono/diheme cytochrome c family protein